MIPVCRRKLTMMDNYGSYQCHHLQFSGSRLLTTDNRRILPTQTLTLLTWKLYQRSIDLY